MRAINSYSGYASPSLPRRNLRGAFEAREIDARAGKLRAARGAASCWGKSPVFTDINFIRRWSSCAVSSTGQLIRQYSGLFGQVTGLSSH
jgi:hypothetical protein